MNGINFKRGVLRLRSMTAAELAEHVGVELEESTEFLLAHAHYFSSICSKQPSEIGSSKIVWHLKSEAETELIGEIANSFQNISKPLESEEIRSAVTAVGESLIKIRDTLNRLKKKKVISRSDDFLALKRLTLRMQVCENAINDLKAAGCPLGAETIFINSAKNDLREIEREAGLVRGLYARTRGTLRSKLHPAQHKAEALWRERETFRRCLADKKDFRATILEIDEASRDLKKKIRNLNVNDISSHYEALTARIRICRSLAANFSEWGLGSEIEDVTIARCTERLERCLRVSEVSQVIERSVSKYMGEWIDDVEKKADGIVHKLNEPKFHKTAPILVIDGTSQKEFDQNDPVASADQQISTQVMRLKMGTLEPDVRRERLEVLARNLSEAAGVAAQVVFIVNSSQPQSVEIANELLIWSAKLNFMNVTFSLPTGKKMLADAYPLFEGGRGFSELQPLTQSFSAVGLIASCMMQELAGVEREKDVRTMRRKNEVLKPSRRPVWVDQSSPSRLGFDIIKLDQFRFLSTLPLLVPRQQPT